MWMWADTCGELRANRGARLGLRASTCHGSRGFRHGQQLSCRRYPLPPTRLAASRRRAAADGQVARCAQGSPCPSRGQAHRIPRGAPAGRPADGLHLGRRGVLSPVHPRPLFDALGRAGTPATWLEPWTIDAYHLDPSRTVIRLMRHGREGHHPDPPDEHDWLPFTTAGPSRGVTSIADEQPSWSAPACRGRVRVR